MTVYRLARSGLCGRSARSEPILFPRLSKNVKDTNGSQFLRPDQCYEDGCGGCEGLEAQKGCGSYRSTPPEAKEGKAPL